MLEAEILRPRCLYGYIPQTGKARAGCPGWRKTTQDLKTDSACRTYPGYVQKKAAFLDYDYIPLCSRARGVKQAYVKINNEQRNNLSERQKVRVGF